jgi:hypothetical protein
MSDINKIEIDMENFLSEETNTYKQIRILGIAVMALSGYTLSEIVKESGFCINTIKAIQRSEDYKNILSVAREKILDTLLAKICLNSNKAIDAVIAILDSEDSSDRNKLAAAKIILDMAWRAKEQALEQRLEQLESLVSQ